MKYNPIDAARVRSAFREEILKPLGIKEEDLVSCMEARGKLQGISVPRKDDIEILLLLGEGKGKEEDYKSLDKARDFLYRGKERIPVKTKKPSSGQTTTQQEERREPEQGLSDVIYL